MNLLRLQAELVDLEQQLIDQWRLDRTASAENEDNNRDAEDRRLYGLDFWHMRECMVDGKHSTINNHARSYNTRTISRVGSATVAALSSTLPTLAILVLYFVKDMVTRLGLIILFTTIFAFALAFFTDAKKVEIFSATAAFAAVEVVYVGSTSAGGGGN
ncbi:hypothetical protein PG997_000923 [Apiospora hydei]|uniref:DUF6594 domain-containing protein n=1 Tax=Apiospora hydei TaxID=1337664 RepID=A0ABR1XC37_9PEZI